MNPAFFQQLEAILVTDRLDAYRQDGVDPATMLARYRSRANSCRRKPRADRPFRSKDPNHPRSYLG
jgi:hypothetical protein